MNKEIKKIWVQALRSGLYEQTTGELTDGEGYCCLGVLCDIAAMNGLVQSACHPFSPDEAIRMWSGLEIDTTVDFNGVNKYLSQVNDDDRQDFHQIADIIEEQL